MPGDYKGPNSSLKKSIEKIIKTLTKFKSSRQADDVTPNLEAAITNLNTALKNLK